MDLAAAARACTACNTQAALTAVGNWPCIRAADAVGAWLGWQGSAIQIIIPINCITIINIIIIIIIITSILIINNY